MRRILAMMLACVFMLGSCAFAEEAEVFSYDFDLRFHLDAGFFPFRQREHIQGYADLLEMLEFRGNVSWCEATQGSDLYLEIIPLTNPSSYVSFRIWGIPTMHRVTSSLLADKAVCFNPGAFLHFTVSAREVFQVPLPYLALMNPQTTVSAFSSLADIWLEHTGEMTGERVVPYETVVAIAEGWSALLNTNTKVNDWIKALVEPVYDDGLAEQDLNTLPEQLINAAGGEPLTVTQEDGTMRIRNASGFVLWDQTESDNLDFYDLNVPETAKRYVPSFSARRETADGMTSFAISLQWECAEETARTDPDTGIPAKRLDLKINAEGLPVSLPAGTEFSGRLIQEGTVLPAFRLFMEGRTAKDGKVRVGVTFADSPEDGEVLFCEGTVTPAVHDEPMAYAWEELVTDYNILNLSYSAQGEMIDAIKRPFVLGMIDFLYELPASACQSIMDDLEDSGILRTVLQ